MANDVQVYLLFCEDFRVEIGTKPMFIGVLSPVFYTSANPGVSDRVYSITALTAGPHVEQVTLKLEVEISQPGKDPERNTFRQTIVRPEDVEQGASWSVFLPLPLTVEEWQNGTKIEAYLTANDAGASASLLARVSEEGGNDYADEDDEDHSSVEKAVREDS